MRTYWLLAYIFGCILNSEYSFAVRHSTAMSDSEYSLPSITSEQAEFMTENMDWEAVDALIKKMNEEEEEEKKKKRVNRPRWRKGVIVVRKKINRPRWRKGTLVIREDVQML
jgi:glutaredoxin 2